MTEASESEAVGLGVADYALSVSFACFRQDRAVWGLRWPDSSTCSRPQQGPNPRGIATVPDSGQRLCLWGGLRARAACCPLCPAFSLSHFPSQWLWRQLFKKVQSPSFPCAVSVTVISLSAFLCSFLCLVTPTISHTVSLFIKAGYTYRMFVYMYKNLYAP